MKRLFLFFSMNRLIVLIIVLLPYIGGIVQAGNSGRCFIRQDRVWLCTSWARGENTAKYMKFMDSKDFMDKTYTRVSTIKKVTWNYGNTNIRIEDDIDETEAWMREESGKVYLLLNGWEPYPYTDSDSSTELYEGLLYDFNAEEGSSFEGTAMYRYYENDPGWYCEGFYHVASIGSDTVGDEEVKCWNVRFSPALEEYGDTSAMSYPIVEGIGIVEYGCLYYAETFDHTSGDNYYNSFDCCMDLDGNILYPQNYNEELPGGGLPSSVITVGLDAYKTGDTDAVPLYDILGRRISAPVPGQLYIQDGKKHIAR